MKIDSTVGDKIYELCEILFPICRSITGKGTKKTLEIIKTYIPDLNIKNVQSGTKCYDWKIPLEWNINDAYVKDESGKRLIDFNKSNLHVVGYSSPINAVISYSDLINHIYTLPDYPDAIPYVTSYYKEHWGFCMEHRQMLKLKKDIKYEVCIDSSLKKGLMNYGEMLIKGKSSKEILLSSYICHPSMANNELSGPTVLTFIVQWLKSLDLNYSYRVVFLPETIGSIYYISKHLKTLKKNVVGGFVLTCMGDNRTFSYLPSRYGNTLSDRVAKNVLKHLYPNYESYSFLDRGSDERQYCSPGVDLPICSIMRTKYHEYPEYHTSKDDLSLISSKGLFGGYQAIYKAIQIFENNRIYNSRFLCEPQLGKRNLYPNLGTINAFKTIKKRMDLLTYSDGKNDLLEISEILNIPFIEIYEEALILQENGLLEVVG